MDRKAFEEEVINSTQGFDNLGSHQKIVHIIETKLLGIIEERQKYTAAVKILEGMDKILKNNPAIPMVNVHAEKIKLRRKNLIMFNNVIEKKENDLGEYMKQSDIRTVADAVFVIMFEAQRKADLFMLTTNEITPENVSNIYKDRMAFEIMQKIYEPGYEARNVMSKNAFALLDLKDKNINAFAMLSNQSTRSH